MDTFLPIGQRESNDNFFEDANLLIRRIDIRLLQDAAEEELSSLFGLLENHSPLTLELLIGFD